MYVSSKINTIFSSNAGRAYEQLRNVLFKRMWIRNQSLNIFYTIMALNDTESLLKIANFLLILAFVITTSFFNNT